MILIDLLIALIVAIAMSALFVGLLGWRRREDSSAGAAYLFFFLVLLFAGWAGGRWIGHGLAWGATSAAPFAIVGILVALVLVATLPPRRRQPRPEEPVQEREVRTLQRREGFGPFFWGLLAAFLVIAILSYL
ncbi:MAG: hypothetical protein R3B81_14450 [bacterium]